jgi:hypothetical protein
MKCIQCSNKAKYIFRGMSYCKIHYEEAREGEKPYYKYIWPGGDGYPLDDDELSGGEGPVAIPVSNEDKSRQYRSKWECWSDTSW